MVPFGKVKHVRRGRNSGEIEKKKSPPTSYVGGWGGSSPCGCPNREIFADDRVLPPWSPVCLLLSSSAPVLFGFWLFSFCFLLFAFCFCFLLLACCCCFLLFAFCFLLLARAAPPRGNLAVQHCTLAGFRPCRKKGDFEEKRWLRWEITFVMTVCDAESIGVVFARTRTPNQKKRFLPIDDAFIGGPLAKFFFRSFVFLLKNCFFRAFQK